MSQAGCVRYADGPGPLAIAHRGGAGLAAENTLEAFNRSYALGVRYLETDVRLTRDGELVAFHDATLDRVTYTSGRVRAHLLDDLERLAVRGGGTVLGLRRLFQSLPEACFTVDLKEAAAIEPLAELLLADGLAERVCVAGARGTWLGKLRELTDGRVVTALSWRSLAQLASPRADVPGWLPRPRRSDVPRTGALSSPGRLGFAHLPVSLGRVPIFRDDLVRRAHDAGVRVLVWTVNEPTVMHRLLDCGVDGVITDRPDLLREVLISRGQWHTPDSYGALSLIRDEL